MKATKRQSRRVKRAKRRKQLKQLAKADVALVGLTPLQVQMKVPLLFSQPEGIAEIAEGWIQESKSRTVQAISLYSKGTLVSVCLLSKMDYDPLLQQKRPFTLNLIWTLPEHRRRGYAKQLLDYVSENRDLFAACSSLESEALFAAAKHFSKIPQEQAHMLVGPAVAKLITCFRCCNSE